MHVGYIGPRQKSVYTYTASRVPTSQTQEVGNVLEVSGVAVVDRALDVGVTVAVKVGNRLFGALRGVARRRRRRAIGRAVGFLGDGALLCWTGHC
jgi:hypothetical protein